MGIFGSLFSRDPRKTLDKASGLLSSDPGRALTLARSIDRSSAPELVGALDKLIAQARATLVGRAIEKADKAEAAEFWQDAADWLSHAFDEAEGAELESLKERHAGLLERHDADERAAESAALQARLAFEDELGADEDLAEDDFDVDFEVFLGMLNEGIAERFSEQPEEFRNAVVALNSGEAAEALEVLESLVESAPDDPLRRLERGRGRLLLGELDGAREDLDLAWSGLGSEALDLAGNQSAPALWAEASLESGHPDEVVERLAEIADPMDGRSDLAMPYGRALLESSRFEEAGEHFARACQVFPRVPDFPFLLAMVLERSGERGRAIAGLEAAVKPSCAGGGCSRPAKHVPSLRSLARMHLAEGNLDAARTWILQLAGARQGRFGAEEHRLSSAYFRALGDEEAAAEAEATAERLESMGPEAMAEPVLAQLGSGQGKSAL